jgi:hypothetical protein
MRSRPQERPRIESNLLGGSFLLFVLFADVLAALLLARTCSAARRRLLPTALSPLRFSIGFAETTLTFLLALALLLRLALLAALLASLPALLSGLALLASLLTLAALALLAALLTLLSLSLFVLTLLLVGSLILSHNGWFPFAVRLPVNPKLSIRRMPLLRSEEF